jgi:small acid-soluble spore protein A (major alpha-type SASP)
MKLAAGQRGRTLIPGFRSVADRMKYEIASELGVHAPPDGYWGDLPARQCGAVGGHIVRRLIEIAEQQLAGGQRPMPRP